MHTEIFMNENTNMSTRKDSQVSSLHNGLEPSNFRGASFASSGGYGSATVDRPLPAITNYPTDAQGLYQDPSPQIVRRSALGAPQVYTQRVIVKFLQPPPISNPGVSTILFNPDTGVDCIARLTSYSRSSSKKSGHLNRRLLLLSSFVSALLRRWFRSPTLFHPIGQRPPPPPLLPPLIIRECPPKLPPVLGPQIITKMLPPLPVPPRSVIIERLPPLPPKPRDVIVERWLPYRTLQKRRVIIQRAPPAVIPKPRNIII